MTVVGWEDKLQVFAGQTTAGEGRLYARLPGFSSTDGWELSGSVHGPECRFAQTLPTRYPLRSLGPGEGLLAECFIPDPCAWSPALPQLYSASIELRHRGAARGRTTRLVGVRPLGPRGRHFMWEGKRWVLRGVLADEVAAQSSAAPQALGPWHAGPTALAADDPDEQLCRAASVEGVLVVASLGQASRKRQRPEEPLSAIIARLARWPAVGIAIIDRQSAADSDVATLRSAAGNLVLAEYFATADLIRPAAWAQAAVIDLSSCAPSSLAAAWRDCPLPLIACRPAGAQPNVAAGRAACDALQSDLAPIGDFAGYIV